MRRCAARRRDDHRSPMSPNGKKRTAPAAPHPKVSNSALRRQAKAASGPCPIMHACGGCTWIGMPYRKQLARKQQAMEELFIFFSLFER